MVGGFFSTHHRAEPKRWPESTSIFFYIFILYISFPSWIKEWRENVRQVSVFVDTLVQSSLSYLLTLRYNSRVFNISCDVSFCPVRLRLPSSNITQCFILMGQRLHLFSFWISLQMISRNYFQELVTFKVKMPTFVTLYIFFFSSDHYELGCLRVSTSWSHSFCAQSIQIVTHSDDEGNDNNNNKRQCTYFVLKVPAPVKTPTQRVWNCQLCMASKQKKGL